MPSNKLSRKEKYYHFKPWYTKGIKISIRTENNLRRLSIRRKDEEIAKQYRKYRNLLTRIKTLAYNLYQSSKLEENKNDKRKIWRTLNDIMRRKQTRGSQIEINSLRDENNLEKTNPVEIANALNKHFNTVGGKMASEVNKNNKKVKDPKEYIKNSPLQSIYLYPIYLYNYQRV